MNEIMEDRKNRILSFMREHSYKPLKYDELAIVLDVPAGDRASMQKLLDEMEAEGLIIKTRKERYAVPERMGLIVGKFQGNPKGFGFVLPDLEMRIYIPANAINGASMGTE